VLGLSKSSISNRQLGGILHQRQIHPNQFEVTWVIPLWLNRGEVSPNDFRGRELFGDIDGPDAGAGTPIKNSLRRLNGRKVQLPIEQEAEDMVLQVKAIQLALSLAILSVGFLVTVLTAHTSSLGNG